MMSLPFFKDLILFQMKRLFRSRLPRTLTSEKLDELSRDAQIPVADIQDWYERFNHCYPRGRLTFDEFVDYLNLFHTQNNPRQKPMTKATIKQIFRLLDIDHDKNLSFDEFFLFHLLINQGTTEDKLKLILNLYQNGQNKLFTKNELIAIFTSMFDILNIPLPVGGFSKAIDEILHRANMNNAADKIVWNTFRNYVMRDYSLLRLLATGSDKDKYHDEYIDDEDQSFITTRF